MRHHFTDQLIDLRLPFTPFHAQRGDEGFAPLANLFANLIPVSFRQPLPNTQTQLSPGHPWLGRPLRSWQGGSVVNRLTTARSGFRHGGKEIVVSLFTGLHPSPAWSRGRRRSEKPPASAAAIVAESASPYNGAAGEQLRRRGRPGRVWGPHLRPASPASMGRTRSPSRRNAPARTTTTSPSRSPSR